MTNTDTQGLVFRHDLPFTPSYAQVIYIEKEYDPDINNLLRQHYDELQAALGRAGLTLCYLPYVSRSVATEEIVRYFTPYRDSKITQVLDSTCLNDYLKRGQKVCPSFILFDRHDKTGYHFFQFVLEGEATELERRLTALLGVREEQVAKWRAEEEAERKKREGTFFCDTLGIYEDDSSYADNNFSEEVTRLMDDVHDKIAQLQQYGVNEMALQRLLTPRVVLSRLRITAKGRILLPDYGNREIKMPPLVKAVYLLFLRHSEGITFKSLPDYRCELTHIYERLTGRLNVEQVRQSVIDVTNPCKNSINEKCARIREAFLREFNDSMAQYYYVAGARACPKGVALNRELVEWEDDAFAPPLIRPLPSFDIE